MHHSNPLFILDHTISWGDIANVLVAVATGVLAFYTWRSVNQGKQAIKDTEVSIDQMKDQLMPYVDLDIEYMLTSKVDESPSPILRITNAGSGPAILRYITVRSDLKFPLPTDEMHIYGTEELAYNLPSHVVRPIGDFIIAKEKSISVLISEKEIPSDQDYEWFSSLSLFYEDVYGRKFRVRLLYCWYKNSRGEFPHLRSLGQEHYQLSEFPWEPINSPDIGNVYLTETGQNNGVLWRYIPKYRGMYRLQQLSRIKGFKVKGISLTHNTAFCIKDVKFDWNGYPIYVLQIRKREPFVLSPLVDTNGFKGVQVTSEKDSSTNWKWGTFGLSLQSKQEDDIRQLYNYVHKTVMKLVGIESNII